MPQRTKVVGARALVLWLLIIVALVLAGGLAAGGLVIYPQFQEKREAQARLAEAEQHYQAGVAFQDVEEWEAAKEEYVRIITLDASYRDVQARLAEIKARLAEKEATATAAAMVLAEQARADAQATAVAAATSTREARISAQATATAIPAATAEALEARYQKGLGYMNMERWEEAKAELEQVFTADPNYKDVQAKLMEVEAEIAKLTPTATPTPVMTPTPSPLVWWKAFPSVIASCEGPKDSLGNLWYEPDFDDSAWTVIALPQQNTIPENRDGFYRATFNLSDFGTVFLNFESDDGIWIYVNGESLGHWGGDCHEARNVGDEESVEITDLVKPGRNHLAVHVSNGPKSSLMDLEVILDGLALPMDRK